MALPLRKIGLYTYAVAVLGLGRVGRQPAYPLKIAAYPERK